jgi:acetyl esterase
VRQILGYLMVVMMAAAAVSQSKPPKRSNRKYPPVLPLAKVVVYKTIGELELRAYIYNPKGHRATDKRAVAVFFFGGGWRAGTPAQFQHQCEYLASRGMVAITADYRVSSRHKTKALQCVADGKSAIRFVRTNAAKLGVDPDRILAGGGSAGGHVAACTGVVRGMEGAKNENVAKQKISSIPNAMALFNPALVLAPVDDAEPFDEKRMATLTARMGTDPKALSPYHHVRAGAPPTIIFHGVADTTVPYRTAELFTAAMIKAKNRCKLVGFADQTHGFFNHGRGGNRAFVRSMRELDVFLADLGYLKGKPTIESPRSK